MVTFSILQAHNGTLEYKSESGKGTEAIIILPAVRIRNKSYRWKVTFILYRKNILFYSVVFLVLFG